MRYLTLFKFVLPIVLILLNTPCIQAHKIRIFAWEESGTIKTETRFSGGRAAKNAAISVTNKTNSEELLSGTTDEHGFFNFIIPKVAIENRYDLNITVNSGDGHKNSWFLNAADYLGEGENIPPSPPLLPTPPKIQNQHEFSTCVVDDKQLSRIIESTLERKLAPIKRSLAEQQERKTSLQDILGGIGYIFGLAGIAAYFKSQKKTS